MIKCAQQKVYSPRQVNMRVTYANEILSHSAAVLAPEFSEM